MLNTALYQNNVCSPVASTLFLCYCPTFARIFYFIRVQELHEHLEGLGLGLSDGHLQQRLQAAQLDVPPNPILLARRVSLVFNILL